MEIYKKYRPKSFKTMIGQDGAINTLQSFVDKGNIPHAMLMVGTSGCGKTTAARIMAKHLGCQSDDVEEINASDKRGIDDIRTLRRAAALRPMRGDARVFIIDEAQKLTDDAQNSLLKVLEDPPPTAYFILCTTDPHKLKAAVKTRCTTVKFGALNDIDMMKALTRVVKREAFKVPKSVLDEICASAEGSARKGLVLLEQIAELKSEADQLRGIADSTFDREESIKLARTLFAPKPQWSVIAVILKAIEKDDAEGIRRMILGYSRAILLKGGPMATKACATIEIFSDPFYDTGNAGLARACFEICHLN